MAKYNPKPGGYTWRQTLVEARQGTRDNIARQEKLLAAAGLDSASIQKSVEQALRDSDCEIVRSRLIS